MKTKFDFIKQYQFRMCLGFGVKGLIIWQYCKKVRIGDNLLLQNQVTMANTPREKFNFHTKQFTDLSDSQWQDIAIFFEDQ